jgi:hypothetical protein
MKKWIKSILLFPLALILLFEEWGWAPLALFFERLAEHSFLLKIESNIRKLSPQKVIFVFALPVFILFPLKIIALSLLGKGYVVLGVFIFILTKIFGTALFARIFQLTKPALLKLKWFGKWYSFWKNWKDHLLLKVREGKFWQGILRQKIKMIKKINELKSILIH